jgi:hypothetical protein
MQSKHVATRIVLVSIAALAFTRPMASQSLGAAASFAVLSSGDVTFKNRDNVNKAESSSGGACPGSVGCPGDVGGVTVLMGRGNGAAPDTVSGDVIASASSSQGLNCSGNPPGTTAICLGNDSEVTLRVPRLRLLTLSIRGEILWVPTSTQVASATVSF